MEPQASSATGKGINQKKSTSGNTVGDDAIPPENRAESGVKRETPTEARRPGTTDPKIKEDRPGQNEVRQRGLHP